MWSAMAKRKGGESEGSAKLWRARRVSSWIRARHLNACAPYLDQKLFSCGKRVVGRRKGGDDLATSLRVFLPPTSPAA